MNFHAERNDLISVELAQKLADKWATAEYKYYWKSNATNSQYFHWHKEIAGGDRFNKGDLSAKLDKFSDEKLVWNILQTQMLGTSDLLRCYVNAYTFGTEALPHTDSDIEGEMTSIVYLNEWDVNWGGETLVFEDDKRSIVRAVTPELGRVLAFPSNYWHVARPISRLCPQLRIVLVYKSRPKKEKLSLEDRMKKVSSFDLNLIADLKGMGAQDIKHSGGTLLNHLVGTYLLLREAGHTETVCHAGLFHSVYGTTVFQHKTTMDRDKIKHLIGEEAEKLVFLFSVLDRPKCWNVPKGQALPTTVGFDILIPPNQLEALLVIEDANLKEQS